VTCQLSLDKGRFEADDWVARGVAIQRRPGNGGGGPGGEWGIS
jgi:hypothetical protein